MNKKVKELVERVRLTDEEIKTIEAGWFNTHLLMSERQTPEVLIAEAQLNKVLNDSELALIDSDQSCKIQRLGSDEYEETAFPALYDNIRRVIPLAEALEEVKDEVQEG